MSSLATVRVDPRGSARRSPTAGNRGQGGKWLRPQTRRRIYERDGWLCVWCTVKVAQQLAPGICLASVDHVVPRSRGGSNRPGNLITCCATCNTKRGHRSVPAFAAKICDTAAETYDYLERVQQIVRRVRAACRRKLKKAP